MPFDCRLFVFILIGTALRMNQIAKKFQKKSPPIHHFLPNTDFNTLKWTSA